MNAMVSKHIAEGLEPESNTEKVAEHFDYLDGIDGSEGTVYRTAAVMRDEPCGSCVRDPSKPHLRTGCIDPTQPFTIKCDVCGERWPHPYFAERLDEVRREILTIDNTVSAQQQKMQEIIDTVHREHQKQMRIKMFVLIFCFLAYQVARIIVR